MKAIIFGINGQDGHYLSKLLEEKLVEVLGVSRTKGNWLEGDVANTSFVTNIIKEKRPEFIFHFAANSTASHAALFENHSSISTGAINILEAVKRHSLDSKVFISGSALQFKNSNRPINEETAFDPSSPYAIERIYTTHLARYYRKKFGLKIYNGYFFNHDSPLRTEKHINQKIAFALKRIREGSLEKIVIGNPDVRKEFNFAGDVMEAVWLLMNQNKVYEAIIGSGEDHSIQEWIEICFKLVNKDWKDYIEIKNDYVPEYSRLVSDPSRMKSLGWKPKTSFDSLAKMMVN